MKHARNQKSGKTLENIFLLTLFICGAFGAFYFFSQGSRSLDQQPVETRETTARPSGSVTNLSRLTIEGIPEAGLPIRFAVPGSTRDLRYVLDLGNGEKVQLEDGAFQYTYRKPGTYRVQLQLIRGEEAELVHSEFINIEAGIEVAAGSF